MMMRTEPTLREKKQAWHAWMFGTTCRVCLLFSALLFGVLYVLQTSASAGTGYEMSDLERRIHDLEQETGSVDVKIAQYSSMQSIEERLKGADFVPVTELTYVALVGSTVARR